MIRHASCLPLCFLAAGVFACDSDSSAVFELELRGMVGTEPFACGRSYADIGTTAAQFVPLDFRMYLHDFAIIGANGEEIPVEPVEDDRWQRDGFALVDFEDGTAACQTGSPGVHTTVTLQGEDAAAVHGIAFSVGVPESHNHLDAATAPAPLNEPGMWWSWLGGYKYMRIDVQNAAGAPYYFHLGSTACEGTPATGFECGHANVPRVTISDFDPDAQALVVDIAKLFENVDITATPDYEIDTVAGCMAFSGDPECPAMFAPLGMQFETQPAPSSSQTLFSLEAR